ncbi:MAG: hypothetical protein C0511_15525 [Hyphomicrobium sp.]|nr:hypothetical protein [Hyphomicrobium sp.]
MNKMVDAYVATIWITNDDGRTANAMKRTIEPPLLSRTYASFRITLYAGWPVLVVLNPSIEPSFKRYYACTECALDDGGTR